MCVKSDKLSLSFAKRFFGFLEGISCGVSKNDRIRWEIQILGWKRLFLLFYPPKKPFFEKKKAQNAPKTLFWVFGRYIKWGIKKWSNSMGNLNLGWKIPFFRFTTPPPPPHTLFLPLPCGKACTWQHQHPFRKSS